MRQFRVAEIFGPTIQGEGRHVGTPCYFIRFGGCDSRCVWCDSPHAVLPDLVAQLEKIDEQEIVQRLSDLPRSAQWVVYSGGNPALFDLTLLTAHLRGTGYSVMVETQGTLWKDWLNSVDEVCVSPKPPSSGNPLHLEELRDFLHRTTAPAYLKIPVFDNADYEYAALIHEQLYQYDMFLSVGNTDTFLPTVADPSPSGPFMTQEELKQHARDAVLRNTEWLMEKVAGDIRMADVRVFPQMHVLAWGNQRGR